MKTPLISLLGSLSLFGAVLWAETPLTSKTNAKQEVVAVFLGEKLTSKDNDEIKRLIFGTLLDQFAEENKIKPTKEELDAFVLKTGERERQQKIKREKDRKKLIAELKTPGLKEAARKAKEDRLQAIEKLIKNGREMEEWKKGKEAQMRQMKLKMAQRFIRIWKINKTLYKKYGGRVIFQQFGPEPLDAYRDLLKEHEKKKPFEFLDKNYEAAFWRYFTNDAMRVFSNKEDAPRIINTPWWLMDKTQKTIN